MLSFLERKGYIKYKTFTPQTSFWKNDQLKCKYRLTKWKIICRPKDQWGWEWKCYISKIDAYSTNDCLNS
jgi:hypothetical protein